MSDLRKPLLDNDELAKQIPVAGYPANETRQPISVDDVNFDFGNNTVQPSVKTQNVIQPPVSQPHPQQPQQPQPPQPQQQPVPQPNPVTYQNQTVLPTNYPPRTALPQTTPHVFATTLDYILCGRSYPTGSTLVKCPYCEAINNTAPAMSTTQCFRCGKFLLFPSTAKGISCPCGEIITLQHVYSSATPPEAYLLQQTNIMNPIYPPPQQ